MGKKGLGGFIKGIFVESVEDEDFDDLPELPTSEQNHEMPDVKEPKADTPKQELSVNKEIVELIKNVMDDNNLDGYDYYEFMQSVAEQKDMPSEKKKFEVVFSVIKGMGITSEHLLNTADHYMSVIEKHQEEFNATIDAEEHDKVVKLKEQAEGIEGDITAKTEQIEALKAEIEQLHNQKVDIMDEALSNEAKITKYRQEGVLAYKLFIGQIKDGKNKINQYIGTDRKEEA